MGAEQIRTPWPPERRRRTVDALRAAGCVFAEEEAELLLEAAEDGAALDAAVARRRAGEPLELVLGWAEFCGLRIPVEAGVFVPRRRTELLARTAVALLPLHGAAPDDAPPVVVDLCCGAGAVAAAVVAATAASSGPGSAAAPPGAGSAAAAGPGGSGASGRRRRPELHAADVDPVAVRCARRALAGSGALVHRGDLFDALPEGLRGRVDVLVANTPYVPTAEIALLPAEARVHEPRRALDGGADGLDVQRRVAAQAPGWLRAGGHLLVETSAAQAPTAVAVMVSAGLGARVFEDEDLGATVVVATRPAR